MPYLNCRQNFLFDTVASTRINLISRVCADRELGVLVLSRRSEHVMSKATSRSSAPEFESVSLQNVSEPPVGFLEGFSDWGANLCPVNFVNSLAD